MDPEKGCRFMGTRIRVSSALFASAAAALAVGLGATTALAATTLTVKVTNGGKYKATAATTVLKDNGISVSCSSTATTKASTATGSIPTATTTATSPVKIGTAATLNFKNCAGPNGKVTVKVNDLPYAVRVDSKTNSAGQTDVMISGVNASVSMASCSFTVTGRAPGFYANGTHQLRMTPQLPVTPLNKARLTISNVTGCSGVVKNGDHPTFRASYTLSRATKISSK
jgi:hypothetical protein